MEREHAAAQPEAVAGGDVYRWVVLTAVASACFTVLVSVTSTISFAYRSPALHIAVETAAGIISLLAALLIYGRFQRSLAVRDLILAAGLFVSAVANLAFSTLPAVAGIDASTFATWAPVGSRLFGAALIAAAAFASARPLHHPHRDARRLLGACAGVLALIGTGVGFSAGLLPEAIEPGLSPESAARPRVVGHPLVLALQLIAMVLYALAAAGFTRRAQRNRDPLILWVAVGTTLAAFARLNYFLFPSLYSEWFYTGDVLRLGFFVALLMGGVAEMRLAQRALAAEAAVDERRRLARDLHDGMAQDLSFIIQHGRRLTERPGAPPGLPLLVTAAEHALDDARHAIAALVRPIDEPLMETLERTAAEAASREGAEVHIAAHAALDVPDSTREILSRVVREAVTNAVRHGLARRVTLELCEEAGLALRIRDNGTGFDVAEARTRPGSFGLVSMHQRVAAIGGELRVSSGPGLGCQVEVRLP